MPGPSVRAECAPATATTVTDEQLFLSFIETCDTAAFTELHARYEGLLLAFVMKRYLRDKDLAEDAVQQAFLNAHAKADQFDPELKFRPWLFTLAANAAINMQVSMSRRPATSLNEIGLDGPSTDNAWDPADYRNDLSGDIAAENERADRIRTAIEALPEGDREAVMKVFYDGLTYKAAAEKLGMPTGSLKTRVHRALKQLRRKLGDEMPAVAVA